ncbi:MAG: hypothetical protein ACREQR_10060 [Candidatus Binataceae bacterium]
MAKLLGVVIFFIGVIGIAAPLRAEPYGLRDSHGVWRDADYWHARHPDWVYRYHPDWAVQREEWWAADHRAHPEWFGNPYWRRYPVWTYGAYGPGHVWRGAGWWHAHNPNWFYAHHPEWAEPYPRWIRADRGGHPEWFHSAYWAQHPRDWNHPDAEYRRTLNENLAYQKSHVGGPEHFEEHGNYAHGNYEKGGVAGGNYHAGGLGGEHPKISVGQYHPPAVNTYHPHESAGSASHSSGGGGGGGHHGRH